MFAKSASGGMAAKFGPNRSARIVLPAEPAGSAASMSAVVALENGADFDETTLRRRLAAELSVYKIPKRFAAVPTAEIPLLPSGKVDMQELKRAFDAG